MRRRTQREVRLWLSLILMLAGGFILGFAVAADSAGPNFCMALMTAPTTNANGTPLTDLAGYVTQWAPVATPQGWPNPEVFTSSASSTPAPNTTVSVPCPAGITDGAWVMRAAARDVSGNRSLWAPIAPFTYDSIPPEAPTNLRLGPTP